jgi:hypothetical protein
MENFWNNRSAEHLLGTLKKYDFVPSRCSALRFRKVREGRLSHQTMPTPSFCLIAPRVAP